MSVARKKAEVSVIEKLDNPINNRSLSTHLSRNLFEKLGISEMTHSIKAPTHIGDTIPRVRKRGSFPTNRTNFELQRLSEKCL